MLRTLLASLIGIALIVLAIAGVIPGLAGIVLGLAGAGIALTSGGRRRPGDLTRSADPHGGASEALTGHGQSAVHSGAHRNAPPSGGF